MTGLDRIIQEIEKDAQTAADEKIKNAQEQSQIIITQATQQAQRSINEAEADIQNQCNEVIKRKNSALELERRRKLLETKQEIIDEMIDGALSKLRSLNDEEYFSLLRGMIAKNLQPGKSGEILLSEKDKRRMPSDFLQQINETYTAHLVLSQKNADIDGGFILVYGNIEENCSFSAIFASYSEQLRDVAREILFD